MHRIFPAIIAKNQKEFNSIIKNLDDVSKIIHLDFMDGEFVDNKSNANYLVTNHYYQRGNPLTMKEKLKKEFELFKEFKVDDIPINSIYKIN